MTDSFLAIGECMVELAPEADGRYALGFAGDSFNTAWYARRLLPVGWRVGYLSAVGTDALSARMLAFMAESGIDTAAVARRAGLTVGLYLIALSNGERAFTYWRGQSAARTLADDPAALAAALAGVRLAYLSGITLAILAPEARARLLGALAAARATGTTVAYDPNLRLRLWPDAAAMRSGIMAGAAVADIVLPSFADEAEGFGDVAPEATAARYAAAGAAAVVVKNGDGPLFGQEGGTIVRLPAVPAAAVVDTTGAGDAFNAGFLAARLVGTDLAAAMTAGATLAARVVAGRGALVPAALAPAGRASGAPG